MAGFFGLDKTVISRSSTLAFGRPFYHYGLISRGAALRYVTGHLAYRVAGASHGQLDLAATRGHRLQDVTPTATRRPTCRYWRPSATRPP